VSFRTITLPPFRKGTLAATVLALALPAAGQYPGQVNPGANKPALRAVAVLEWTGDEQQPKANRVIPVTVFDGQQLQDAGIYLTQPEPLALQSEVEYQLKQDGKNTGLFLIDGAALQQGSWVGHGKFEAQPKPKPAPPPFAWKAGADDADSDVPILHRKTHPGENSGGANPGSGSGPSSQGPSPDPDRPTLHRSSDSGDSSAGNAPAPDPDRPTLHKSSGASANSETSGADSGAPGPQKPISDYEGNVSSVPGASDPNRPHLIRGKSSDSGPSLGPDTIPGMAGLPENLKQAVAVSDSRNTPEHLWSYSWANPADEAKYKSELEDLARAALGLNPPRAPAKAPAKMIAGRRTKPAPPPPPAPLFNEQFRVFELAYGSGATMVFSARTAGSGADEKFVTFIAQPDLYGNLVVLEKNLTDAAHLDENPRLRLIDAVDAMADNRGELLFELRGATERQFALYRVLRGQATELFVSGGRAIQTASAN